MSRTTYLLLSILHSSSAVRDRACVCVCLCGIVCVCVCVCLCVCVCIPWAGLFPQSRHLLFFGLVGWLVDCCFLPTYIHTYTSYMVSAGCFVS